jgi:hypothetical protein
MLVCWQLADLRDIFVAYDVEHAGELNRARFSEAFMAAGALPLGLHVVETALHFPGPRMYLLVTV